MSDIDPIHRNQIEDWLGRPLTEAELQPVSSLEVISDEQLAVVATIRPHNIIATMLFLRTIVPSASRRALDDFAEDVERVVAARRPVRDWPNLPLFERYLGRPLVAEEKATVASLTALLPAQLAAATELAHKELPVAFLYLHRVAPTESIDACQKLAKQLAG